MIKPKATITGITLTPLVERKGVPPQTPYEPTEIEKKQDWLTLVLAYGFFAGLLHVLWLILHARV